MKETSKMNALRRELGYDEYFRGKGIDIGAGNDPLSADYFTSISSVVVYDLPQGDANRCENIPDGHFDFVYSSHCLEHMHDPEIALGNWLRICRPGGHVIVAVPHEVYYEKNLWPSYYNRDHKWSFRTEKTTCMPKSIWVEPWLEKFSDRAEVKFLRLFLENFDFTRFWADQTLEQAICQVEFVLQKKPQQ